MIAEGPMRSSPQPSVVKLSGVIVGVRFFEMADLGDIVLNFGISFLSLVEREI